MSASSGYWSDVMRKRTEFIIGGILRRRENAFLPYGKVMQIKSANFDFEKGVVNGIGAVDGSHFSFTHSFTKRKGHAFMCATPDEITKWGE